MTPRKPLTLTEQLIVVADRWCRGAGRSRSRVSTLVFGDGSRLDGVAAGKDLNTRSWEKAMAWFSANWPADLDWPEGIERPDHVADAGKMVADVADEVSA